ncbi:SRPBCC domain-containing protein [Nonomuraea sp. B19D2]|uniref:SRPBCC family protein n=1 Tax=Nonomuraea sp. B19D2 TaxID=3159561 RepID=UPI0032DA5324
MWRALTEPELVARWLMPNDFKPQVGHRFTFTTEPKPQVGFDRIGWRSRHFGAIVAEL